MLPSGVEEEGAGAPQGIEPLAVNDRSLKQNRPEGLSHREGDENDSPNFVRRSLGKECRNQVARREGERGLPTKYPNTAR